MTIFVADLDSSEGAPDSWPMVPLGELGQWGSGGTPKRGTAGYYQGEIPWLKISDLTDDDVVDSEEKITPLALKNSSAKLLQPGALLIAMYGSIGKLGLNTIACATNQAIAFCYPNERVSLRYLFWALRAFRPQLISEGKGGTQQNISQGVLKDFKIPVPPRARQDQIVHLIESTLHALGTPSNRLATIPGLLKKFCQSVLAAACSGQLTADWREQNSVTASPDLTRLVKPKGKKAAEQAVDLELPDIPDCYAKASVGEIVNLIQYGTSSKSGDFVPGRVPVLRMGNIQDGTLDWADLKFADENKEISSLLLVEGDILFNRTNSPDLVGKTAVFKGQQKATFASYLIRLRVHPELAVPDFVAYWINSSWGREWAQLVKTDGVSQSNINGTKLSAMPIPLPSVMEQTEIVRRVESLFALADSIEARLAEATAQVERTTQAILARAFRGEL